MKPRDPCATSRFAANDMANDMERGTVRPGPLHWGCGAVRSPNWINVDRQDGAGIDISCDIVRDGLPFERGTVPYIFSQHALQQLKLYDILFALREFRRVLRPGGVLRLGLPDFDRAIEAYLNGDQSYFWCWDWRTLSGNFITQITNYNFTCTPLTYEFTEELLQLAGFEQVRKVAFRETQSPFPAIVELDSRPEESFYVEAIKAGRGRSAASPGPAMPSQVHLSWTADPSLTLTVTWHTVSPESRAEVTYRACGRGEWHRVSGTTRRSPGTGALHRATLTGLRPATRYEYRVSSDEGAASPTSGTFRTSTAPAPGPADFRFAFISDVGVIGRPDGLATGAEQVIDELLAEDLLFVLGGGDYAYADTDRRFGEVNEAIDAWFSQMEPVFARFPFMAQYGNHEILLEERFRDWAPRFAHPQGFDQGRSYSFEVGDAHFTSLFAPAPPVDPDRLAWLEADLADARRRGMRWLIVYQHEPIFAHGRSHPAQPELRKFLAPVFERHRVDLHLSGHDQNYERTYPLVRAGGDPVAVSSDRDCYAAGMGVVYAKVSPSGKMSNIRRDFSRFTVEQPGFVAARDDTMHHYAIVTVTAKGELSVTVHGLRGDGTPKASIDAFRIVATP